MNRKLDDLMDRLLSRRSLSRWADLADAAPSMPIDRLRGHRGTARSLRRQLDRLLHHAEHRLALPLIGSTAMRTALGTDWQWRPDLWSGPLAEPGRAGVLAGVALCDAVTVFHDCALSELTVRQVRNLRDSDLAPFGLAMDVFRFDGSYLSLVIDLPAAVLNGLGARHVLRLACAIEMEKPLEVYARINLALGTGVEQIVRQFPAQPGEVVAEFDLAYTALAETRASRIWIDLIFDGPEMNQIILRDVALSRRTRADL